jgi:rhodanese-related sulfurtransferase
MRTLILATALLAVGLAGLLVVSAGHKKEAHSVSQQQQPAQTGQAQTQPTPADGVRRVTVEELRAALEKGTAVVVDVRVEESYKAGHIKGALWIPGNEIASRTKELPKDKLIVAYCSWPNEHSSARAVQEIKQKGFENAAALLGGYAAWEKAGLPVEKKWKNSYQ